MERTKIFNELDFPISILEIKDTLKRLRNGKSSGVDRICNEMLKHANDKMLLAFKKLFNLILVSSKFPEEWSKGIISAIYKSGDSMVCDNYRGITVSSCLGKLFTSILNKRLLSFVSKEKLIPENQIGFLPNSRTSDHIYVKCH